MSDTNYSKGRCQNCGGHLEFPATGTGLAVACPHCGILTTLIPNLPGTIPPNEDSPAQPRSRLHVLWRSVVLVLILAAATAVFFGFKRTGANPPVATMATPPVVTHSEIATKPSPPPETNDLFVTGTVLLRKTEGSALINAVGAVRNNSNRQRFGVRIDLDLLDKEDNIIGTTGDYIAVLEPHQDWQFRALLTQPKAVKAKVAKIEEQK